MFHPILHQNRRHRRINFKTGTSNIHISSACVHSRDVSLHFLFFSAGIYTLGPKQPQNFISFRSFRWSLWCSVPSENEIIEVVPAAKNTLSRKLRFPENIENLIPFFKIPFPKEYILEVLFSFGDVRNDTIVWQVTWTTDDSDEKVRSLSDIHLYKSAMN